MKDDCLGEPEGKFITLPQLYSGHDFCSIKPNTGQMFNF